MNKNKRVGVLLVLAFVAVDLMVWREVVFGGPGAETELYFLDVGQGDAELVVLPGNVKILTDAGPDAKVVRALEGAIGRSDRYIDIAVVSHPQLDHFNGFHELMKRYRFGMFVVNGRSAAPEVREWKELMETIEARRTPVFVASRGDRIRFREHTVRFLAPDRNFIQSGELNDTSLVELLETPLLRALFAADIGFAVENYLLTRSDIRADILKVGHHGSKYSSGTAFMEAVQPKVAVIEVGARNRYGHPTKEALGRLASRAIRVFRTDESGTIEIRTADKKLRVFTEK